MRLEHHLVGGYVRYISPHIIIIIIIGFTRERPQLKLSSGSGCIVVTVRYHKIFYLDDKSAEKCIIFVSLHWGQYLKS